MAVLRAWFKLIYFCLSSGVLWLFVESNVSDQASPAKDEENNGLLHDVRWLFEGLQTSETVCIRVLRGLKFLSAPSPHPQNLSSPRTRRNVKNLIRSRPAPDPHALLTLARPALFPSQTYTCHCVS